MLDPDQSGEKREAAFWNGTVSAAFKGCEGLAQDCLIWKHLSGFLVRA
jgi:hypothetical protein